MKRFIAIVLLFVAPGCKADSIQTVAADLRDDSPVPFRYGVATDLAANLLTAQSLASYAGSVSLELSIESVLRAIGIDGTSFVGWASSNPITWLQSTVAIDPSANVGITPSALYFGEQAVVSTIEPSVWILIVVALVGAACARRWLHWSETEPAPPAILTEFGPVTEWARKQAAMNMLEDSELRERVFKVVLRECGGDIAKAGAEFLRRYPELGELGDAQ